jgi:hypothetical protein
VIATIMAVFPFFNIVLYPSCCCIPRDRSRSASIYSVNIAAPLESAHATHDLAVRPHAFRSAAARRDASPTSWKLAWLVKTGALCSVFQPSSLARWLAAFGHWCALDVPPKPGIPFDCAHELSDVARNAA